MAQPAKKQDPVYDKDKEDLPKTAREKADEKWGMADNREELQAGESIEDESNESSKTARDKADERWGMSASDLDSSEKQAGEHENSLGGGYKPSVTKTGKIRFTKKKAIIGGGGIAGIIISLFFFFSLSGPFQFVHFTQLLQQFHFNSQEDQTDVRAFRLIRFIKSGGDVREARVGTIASRLGNKMEARFRTAGFIYRGSGGNFAGFDIDRQKGPFAGMTEAKIKAELDASGIPTASENGRLYIPGNESYRQNQPLTENMMRRVGYSKVASAIQSRTIAGKWLGFYRWHPMRKADARVNQTIADFWDQHKKKFNERVGKGSHPVTGSFIPDLEQEIERIDCEPNCTAREIARNIAIDEENRAIRERNAPKIAEADEATKEIVKIDEEGRAVNGEDQRERADKTNEYANNLRGKLVAGGVAGAFSATAVLCTVDDVNKQYEGLKQARIILPLIRLSLEMIAVGNQVMDGNDVDLDQLGAYDQLFEDPKTGSWVKSPSIMAEQGEQSTRELTQEEKEQKQTLDRIGQDSPFTGVIDAVPGGQSSVDKLCGTTSQIIQVVIAVPIAFITGGTTAIFTAAVQSAVSAAVTPIAIHYLASMLAGTAVDPYAEGAVMGTNANYGTRLAASTMNVARGGKELSPAEASEIEGLSRANLERRFNEKSVASRLLDPYEPMSAISKLLRTTTPDISSNIAKISSSILDIGKMFGALPSYFMPSASAAPAIPFDYQFSEYGFSAGDIDNGTTYNPYENARAVVSMLPGRADLVGRAKECFGVVIGPDSSGAIGVTHVDEAEAPNPYNETEGIYTTGECNDPSTEWLRLRMFIFDTTTMDAISCIEEDNQESCDRVGFSAPPPSTGGGGGGADQCDRSVFSGQNPGESDSVFADRVNPPPSGDGANYGQGAAPVRFPGVCMGPGSDDRHDLSYTRSAGGGYEDSTGQRYDDKGRKI